MHLGLVALLLSILPLAHVGEELAAPAPGTIYAPGAFHATVRVPQSPDRLFIVGKWTMQDLDVTIQRHGEQTHLHAGDLPGARFGIELPADAWQADAVVIDGTAVNRSGGPKLVAGTALYARATSSWPAIALFGMVAGLAIVSGLLAIALRSAATGWFSALTALNALLALPALGAIRPPAAVNQSLHALLVTLAILASIAFARLYLGRINFPRHAAMLALIVASMQIVYVVCGDIWQDRFITIPEPFDLALYCSLEVILLVLGVRAIRAGRRDAGWYAAAQLSSILGFIFQELPTPLPADIAANAVSLIALTCGLAFALRRREDERGRLERAVRVDALTGLLNRGTFDSVLSTEWSRAARIESPISAIMIDVDNFKHYNDVFGHLQGDEALRKVGSVLGHIVQRREDCIARYGGEEFIALLPGADIDTASAVAERIRTNIESLHIPNAAGTGYLTVSLGVSEAYADITISPLTLVASADQALYEAKRLGRNTVVARDAEYDATVRDVG